MSDNIFKYPGGKTDLSDWIISHFCDHRTYVEVFGGSAAVLGNKEPSTVEILNDRDGDIVQFFEVLRDRPDELVSWLRDTPHSRELHSTYADEFYDGYRPNDPVARAGRFWYLRETQFAAKYTCPSGYNGSKKRNVARSTATKRERLREFSRRFDHVQIESLDFADLFERYDSPETLFYCDPPYVEEGDDLYSGSAFDHRRFVDALFELEGDWIVSYTDLPPELKDMAETIVARDQRVRMRQGQGDWEKTNTERLVMSYDPADTPSFEYAGQTSVDDF